MELRRDELPPLERAVSDTLDTWMIQMHGIFSSWADPEFFISLLAKNGYKIVKIEEELNVAISVSNASHTVRNDHADS